MTYIILFLIITPLIYLILDDDNSLTSRIIGSTFVGLIVAVVMGWVVAFTMTGLGNTGDHYVGPVAQDKVPKYIVKTGCHTYKYEDDKTKELKTLDKVPLNKKETISGKAKIRVGMYSTKEPSFDLDFKKNPWTGIYLKDGKPEMKIDKIVEKIDTKNSNFEIENHSK